MVRAVLDTVVFVRSLLNPLSRWGRLVFLRGDEYRLVASEPVLTEILEVLDRPRIASRFRFVAGMDKGRVIELLTQAETIDVDAPAILAVARDPNDDKFLATAKAGRADYLVTEDADLLVLGSYEGAEILDAAAFLRRLDEIRTDDR